jgi:hypothetical protein
MRFCRLNRVEPSLLLHPLDFLGAEDESQLSFFPGMQLSAECKMRLGRTLLGWMAQNFQCVTMLEHSRHMDDRFR